jgi:hypothetical protein
LITRTVSFKPVSGSQHAKNGIAGHTAPRPELRRRASAFTFFNIMLLLKTAYFEERIHRKVESNLRFAVEKGSKKGLGSKNFFDFFDLAVKILQILIVSRNMKVNAGALPSPDGIMT